MRATDETPWLQDSFDGRYSGGRWQSASGTAHVVVDPRTARAVATVRAVSPEEVDDAVAAAVAALPGWSATAWEERAGALASFQRALEARAERIVAAITLELGAPEKIARAIHAGLPVAVTAATIEAAAALAHPEEVGNSLIIREPVGVVAAITPWNYPVHQAVAKIAPAIVAGCTVVHKPSELTPLSARLIAEAVDASDIPAGVYNLVVGAGEVGSHLVRHPDVDMVSFTGSTRVGRDVGAAAGRAVKRVALELGGKSASIVLDDVDDELLRTAVKVTMANCFLNSGQTCTAWTRLLVPAHRLGTVEAAVAEFAVRHRAGETLGPLVSERQRERVLGLLREAVRDGARVLVGGPDAEVPAEGFHVAPTVLADVAPDATIAREEVFGPVLCVIACADEEDAVRIANGTDYGLAGGVWSASREHALAVARRIRAGQIDINGAAFNPRAPFGGVKASGVGRELGAHGIAEFLEPKAVQL
ncbi:aldehyde dehydrogenase family protein [Microbacterium sp. No. 7]|uniref:aldehyde dehydrogenase family protein n=1 Tax=Microbacterium sp. No. 7 TaxID=1714373 RepID=UPI0006D05706|nr:aldehyde dehydrogenase family protein [Microbacterium sp. No. 7]ALJ18814.1 aldehyde dehydrogenase [Microbacterium sp. No. 7]